MTDQQLEQRLRGWYRDEIGEHEGAPAALRATVTAIPAQQRRPIWVPRRFAPMNPTRFAVAAVIGVLAVGAALYAIKPTQPPVGGPTPTLNGSATPTKGPASGSGSWTITGAMANPREAFMAIRLVNGRVLVAGGLFAGSKCCQENAKAELYDPLSGSWVPTGSMVMARGSRYESTATLLHDGRVLVAGGGPYGQGSTDAEVYDPANGSWATVGAMTEARHGHTATLLPDGRVLVTGGSYIPSGNQSPGTADASLSSAELFDPVTGAWTATSPMSVARAGHTAALLPDGTVLVAGGIAYVTGSNIDEGTLDSAELYDPATGSWTGTGRMTTPRRSFVAMLQPDGRVLALGGYGDTNGVATVERYDPTSRAWTYVPNGNAEVLGASSATLLNDGRVLVTGAGFESDAASHWVELYDPADGSWTAASPFAVARVFGTYTATLLLDGTVLVAGGEGDVFVDGNETFPVLASAELYHPAPRP